MEENKIEKDINPIQLFDKSINNMELKIKDICVNNIKIKENLNSIKRSENKINYLDDMILDKKSELNLLKKLLILKEQKKLNFEDIISKYLYQLILIDNRTNDKLDLLKKKNYIINRKQKIINMLIGNFNDNLNSYLKNDKKDKNYNNLINDNDELKEKLSNRNSDKKYFYSNGINKYINRDPISCKTINQKINIFNDDKDNYNHNIKKNNELEKGEIEEYINDFENYINNAKLNEKKNCDNQDKINNINVYHEKNNNSINNKQKKDNIININNINNNNNDNLYLDDNKTSNNKSYYIQNNKMNFKPNKNLQKSRENLKNLIVQNDKEKSNKRKKEKYYSFIKLLISKIKQYYNQLNKIAFNKLKNYIIILKFKNILNKYIKYKKNIIISKIKEILKQSSFIYNQNIKIEIINDDEFLNGIKLNKNSKSNKKDIIKDIKSNLDKLKCINKEIKNMENIIRIYSNKLMDKT